MHWTPISRLFGMLLMLYSASFAPSIGVALFYQDDQWSIFAISLSVTLLAGLAMWFPVRQSSSEISVREGYFVVSFFWIMLGAVGSLPFLLSLHLDFTDAMFESLSGFTSTGSTVIVGLDELPRSLLYHRQQIQWLGGMGIIVLAVAVLPLLGIGGMQLYQAEASGVAKHEKITPRIAETVRSLWLIVYSRDGEFRTYLYILLFTTLIITMTLFFVGTHESLLGALRVSAFQVVSLMTSTGFRTETFSSWPLFVPLLIIMVAHTGGCAGSTSGGIKVLRIILLSRLGLRQLFHMAHPQAISVIKLNNRLVPDDQLFSVWGFYTLYIFTSLVLTLAMMAAGLDLVSAFGAVSATITLTLTCCLPSPAAMRPT